MTADIRTGEQLAIVSSLQRLLQGVFAESPRPRSRRSEESTLHGSFAGLREPQASGTGLRGSPGSAGDEVT